MNPSHPPISRSSTAVLSTTWIALLATGCDEQAAPPTRMGTDSAGISIVTSDPLQSDAVCSLSDEPTFLVGDNQDDESQWFSSVSGVGGQIGRASCRERV